MTDTMLTTYGEHAENAARALNALIASDLVPDDPGAVEQLLGCRQAAIDALRERLFDLGQDHWYPAPGHQLARSRRPAVSGIEEKLATQTDTIAFAVPTLLPQEPRAPTDVLGTPSPDATVEAWRRAAVELLAGSHALSAAGEQPWRHDPGTGWWVMGDVAVALEAVLVLDDRLEELGLLGDHDRPALAMSLEERRLILSQTARVAAWHATSDLPDQAIPQVPRPPSRVSHPISLVSVPEDLAAAQHRLSRFLRPFIAFDSAFDGEPEISADSARQITASQLYLCRAFSEAAAGSPKNQIFAPFFEERAEVLAALQPQISHLVDVVAREPNRRRFWQQSELSTAVIRMGDQGVPIRLQPQQMAELAHATHQVTHNLAKVLRRELLRTSSNLRDAHPRHWEGPVRIRRRTHLEATLGDLVNMPAPREPVARFNNPMQRAALKESLDLTPSGSRTPQPYPAARRSRYDAPSL